MVIGKKPNWLCNLGLHKWRDYGEKVVVTWKEPGRLGYMHAGRLGFTTHGREVLTHRECLRCGIKVKRKLVHNSDGTLSCIGWDPLLDSEYEKLPKPQITLLTSLTQRIFIDLPKYFIHGLIYAILGPLIFVGWIGLPFVSPNIGSALVYIIGLGFFFLFVGVLNYFLTSFLWFSVKLSLLKVFFHGLALSIVLFFVNVIFNLIPNLIFPNLLTSVITFILGAIFGGMVGKAIAGFRKKEE